MHNQLRTRFPAGRGGHLKRFAQAGPVDFPPVDTDPQTGDAFSFTVHALPPKASAVFTPQTTNTALPSSIVTQISSPSVIPPPSSTTLTQLPSSSALFPPSEASSPAENSGQALSSKKLPGGTIAAVVIVLLLVLVALSVFIARKFFIRKRMRKTATWAGIVNQPVSSADYGFGHGNGSDNVNVEKSRRVPVPSYTPSAFSPGQEFGQNRTPTLIIPPPMSYNNLSPTSGATASPISRPGTGYSLGSPAKFATVQFTFIPSLPDELTISTGETVRVLSEFDDGWAFCANGRGEQGMVPLECLDRSDTSLVTSDYRNSRRVSSLASGARY